MGGVLSILFKAKAGVAGKKLNRKCPTRACGKKIPCREPSRILQKVLTPVFIKSRKLRRLVYRTLSTFHCSESQCQE